MRLIKVLIACLFAMPAMAHHEGATTASSIDLMTVALVSAAVLLIAAISIKALPQSIKAVAKIRSSENQK